VDEPAWVEALVIRFLLGDAERRVAIRTDGATVDGQSVALSVEALTPGTFAARLGMAVETFHCVRDGDDVHLAWRGRVYRFEFLSEGRRAAQRHASGGLEAPMPGKVTAVKAREGQAVRKGEEILVVEAMKMENAIRAPRDGTIRRIAAKEGDMVGPGKVLVEFE
jgi:3-methylcrotonyl-CoA carboxylase alpha subunit